jgi:hypothetical protein
MFRRSRTDAAPAADPANAQAADGAVGADEGAGALLDSMVRAGWVLPRGVRLGGPPSWTFVGTVASTTATPVDTAGLVVGEGWSLDWWIGADDRWHVPAREPAVRQQLVADAPVVETLVRIPGGDAVHRAYGIRSPREVGDEWVVSEVHNATPVPFAVALVVRPFVADGLGAVSEITVEPVEGGVGRDVAHLVRVDGRPAIVLPRAPLRTAAGSASTGDVLDAVAGGQAGRDLVGASCPDGLATLAMVFPLTHTSTLRAVLPVGPVDDPILYPQVVPDAEVVAAGWDVHRRGPRLDVPEPRIVTGFERARARVQLAHDGEGVRRDGHRARTLDPGATELILGALDLLDRPADVGTVIARWPDLLGSEPGPDVDAMVLTAVARHWRTHRVDALLDWVLPEVAAAVERIDRAHRKGRLTSVAGRRRAASGLAAAAALLTDAGQRDAGTRVAELAASVGRGLPAPEPATAVDHLVLADDLAIAGDPAGIDAIRAQLEVASATGTWPGPGVGARPGGDDLAASAALVIATRDLLVAERPDGLAILPHHPDRWYGGAVELHDAPTAFGTISFAIRWHGTRPALLWELHPHEGLGTVALTAPGLDPSWRTTETRGDALLGEVAPPEGAEALTLVAEHPDIDPAMRRPGTAPDLGAGPADPLLDGGGFS